MRIIGAFTTCGHAEAVFPNMRGAAAVVAALRKEFHSCGEKWKPSVGSAQARATVPRLCTLALTAATAAPEAAAAVEAAAEAAHLAAEAAEVSLRQAEAASAPQTQTLRKRSASTFLSWRSR